MINENIKAARKAKGMSQEKLAEQLNVVRQTVSKWENGLSAPDADTLIQMAHVLEVPVSQLLGVELENHAVQDLAKELSQINEQLTAQIQKEKLHIRANKKRELILGLSFVTMIIMLVVKNELLSLILAGGCALTALIILYRNLSLLTSITAGDVKLGPLQLTTIFDIAILVFVMAIVALHQSAVIKISEDSENLLAMVIVSIVMLFGGFIAPKLSFNRHTGLRLPWTIQDEDTWNVAHKILGYISLPVFLLYLASACTIRNFEIITLVNILLWIGIPGFISFIFFWKKFHRKI